MKPTCFGRSSSQKRWVHDILELAVFVRLMLQIFFIKIKLHLIQTRRKILISLTLWYFHQSYLLIQC